MCSQDCRTFLWGGTGVPSQDEEDTCFCVCADDSWSDLNILGGASCVPVKAHHIFGSVGLAISVAALGHAAYHLHRQVRYTYYKHTAVLLLLYTVLMKRAGNYGLYWTPHTCTYLLDSDIYRL